MARVRVARESGHEDDRRTTQLLTHLPADYAGIVGREQQVVCPEDDWMTCVGHECGKHRLVRPSKYDHRHAIINRAVWVAAILRHTEPGHNSPLKTYVLALRHCLGYTLHAGVDDRPEPFLVYWRPKAAAHADRPPVRVCCVDDDVPERATASDLRAVVLMEAYDVDRDDGGVLDHQCFHEQRVVRSGRPISASCEPRHGSSACRCDVFDCDAGSHHHLLTAPVCPRPPHAAL